MRISLDTDSPKIPAYVDRRRSGSTCTLRAVVRRSSISQPELERFIREHGVGPDGRYERFEGTRDDGLIEFERTLENVRTSDSILHEACVLASQMESTFSRIEVQIL